MAADEDWDLVIGCAESGTVGPEVMMGFFEGLTDVLGEAETLARAGHTSATCMKLRELQARCERLIVLIRPAQKIPLRAVV